MCLPVREKINKGTIWIYWDIPTQVSQRIPFSFRTVNSDWNARDYALSSMRVQAFERFLYARSTRDRRQRPAFAGGRLEARLTKGLAGDILGK